MLLTLLLVCVIFMGAMLGSFIALAKHPPVIHVDLPDLPPFVVNVDMGQMIPVPLVVQVQSVLPDQRPSGLPEEPMPNDVFKYVAQESEEHARISRTKYARHLRNELGSWDLALARLKMEDGA